MFKGRIDTVGLLLGFYYCLAPVLVSSTAYVAATFLVDGFAPGRAFVESLRTIGVPLLGSVWLALSTLWMAGLLARRWHDLNKSGWFALLGLIPFVGVAVLWLLVLCPGNSGMNRFGEYRTPRGIFEVLLGEPTLRSSRKRRPGANSRAHPTHSRRHTDGRRRDHRRNQQSAVKEPQG